MARPRPQSGRRCIGCKEMKGAFSPSDGPSPIPRSTFWMTRGNRFPLGSEGELYIGGEGLARGYFERPELTAEKFVPDPFSALPQARMYRTGDLARFREDGNVEYLGRLDHQVKIRGFRIELGEIEAVLDQHADVLRSVVVAREESSGRQAAGRLCGLRYRKALWTSAELREHARKQSAGLHDSFGIRATGHVAT